MSAREPAYFFFGTLRHRPLLEVVLGRSVAPAELTTGSLPGHSVRNVADAPFPILAPAPGDTADGCVFAPRDPADRVRLDYFESAFDYAPEKRRIDIATGQCEAMVYVAPPDRWTPGPNFTLANWAADWAEIACEAAHEIMARFEAGLPAPPAEILPFLRARAWSRIMARRPAPATLRRTPDPGDVELVHDHPGFHGFFRMRALDLRHRRFDGGWSETMSREIFGAFDAALILPYDPVRDAVLLIEQLRFGPIQRGDPAPWVLEPIAGLVDAGEDPEICARREALEEARLALDDLRFIGRAYASPGYSSEFFHFYLGLADLSGFNGGVAGLESEHEDIRSHVIPFERAMALFDSGEINAAPLAMMLLWLARHRETLRRSA